MITDISEVLAASIIWVIGMPVLDYTGQHLRRQPAIFTLTAMRTSNLTMYPCVCMLAYPTCNFKQVANIRSKPSDVIPPISFSSTSNKPHNGSVKF
jgi:hypothetical protein